MNILWYKNYYFQNICIHTFISFLYIWPSVIFSCYLSNPSESGVVPVIDSRAYIMKVWRNIGVAHPQEPEFL